MLSLPYIVPMLMLSAGMRELEELSLELCNDICALRYLARARYRAYLAAHREAPSSDESHSAALPVHPHAIGAGSSADVSANKKLRGTYPLVIVTRCAVLMLQSRLTPGRPDEAEAAESGLVRAP